MKVFNCLLMFCLSLVLLSACNGGGSNSSFTPQIQYTTLNYYGDLESGGATGLTGIRQVGTSSNVYITGNYTVSGFGNGTLYVGPILGGGIYYTYNYPSATGATVSGTNVYSADNGIDGNVELTGTYNTVESGESYTFGFYYNGAVTNNPSSGWQTLVVPNSLVPTGQPVGNTYPHSIMGGQIVGNYETPITAGNGFAYDIATESYTAIVYPNSRYTTVYGIWWNGESSYTITGGYSSESRGTLSYGYVADYNSVTRTVTNWTSYTYNNQPEAITHFEGITTDGRGGYNLAASGGGSGLISVAFVNIRRLPSGGFSSGTWIPVSYPNSSTTTADTVYTNHLLGVYEESGVVGLNGYVATIP